MTGVKRHAAIPVLADCVLGIDNGLKAFAMACGRADDVESAELQVVKSESVGTDVAARWQRYNVLCEALEDMCRRRDPAIAVIEHYAYSYQQTGSDLLYESGWQVRATLARLGIVTIEVMSTTLKKFAGDDGRVDKVDMQRMQQDRYGVRLRTTDESDAWGCMCIASCLTGFTAPMTVKQHEVIKMLRNTNGLKAPS